LEKAIEIEICNVLDAWIKAKEGDRKKVVDKGSKHIGSLKESRLNVAKTKDTYEKTMQATAAAFEQFKKAEKDEINQPDKKNLKDLTKKANANWIQLKEKITASESAYQAAVKKCNEEIESFKVEKMPGVLDDFQKWEEERYSTLLNTLKTIEKLEQQFVPAGITAYATEISEAIKSVNIDADFKESVETAKHESELGQPVEFVPSKVKIDDNEPKTVQPTTPTSPTSAPTSPTPSTTTTTTKDFGTMTAEEKAEQEKKQKQIEKESAEKKAPAGPSPEEKAKTDALKSQLFGGPAESDIFK